MKFSKNLSAIHGYLCGDGYVSRNLPHQKHIYYSIGFRNTNLELLLDFQSKFYDEFKIIPKLVPGQRCIKNSKELYYKLMENGPYHSYIWIFPDLNKTNSKYWLRAFFDCEGWVEIQKRNNRSIRLECVNVKQILKIQKALLKINIKSKIYIRKNRKCIRISILDKTSLINYQKEIGFLHPEKKKNLKKAINSFPNYNWSFNNIKKVIKNKSKLKKPYIIRITSIIKNNLNTIQKYLVKKYFIESKIYKISKKSSSVYFELNIQKKESVLKMIKNNLINSEIQRKLAKSL